ncbi:hypothetical protein BJ170DRAFT_679385 [Xylariales sp. AK1849]|nr:hypothetical protein BJ170DRAFT_679385 [Xylariales sp. AK1849]
MVSSSGPAAEADVSKTEVTKSDMEAKPVESPAASIAGAPAASSPTGTSDTNTANGARSSTTTTTAPLKNDDVNPIDFQGDVQTNNDLPSQESLRKLEKYTVLDESGKSHTFQSLYTGPNVARRVLIIFIRHFFCGMCQEYLRTLSASITPDGLLGMPVSTSIAVIGCGSHKLIKSYLEQTNCPYPVYADNTQHLYKELGMIRTLSAGVRPAYMQHRSMAQTVASGITQALRQVKSGLVLQMGDQKQVGGEFLFEPASMTLATPISTPQDEQKTAYDFTDDDAMTNRRDSEKSEEKRVTWCHRMRNTRDHVELPELMDVLGLDGKGMPVDDHKRWAKALKSRKGTGLSMASQMSRMSVDAKGSLNGNGHEHGHETTT